MCLPMGLWREPWGRAVTQAGSAPCAGAFSTAASKTLTYQPPGEAPASGPRGAGRRTAPWTAAHLGPARVQRWLLVPVVTLSCCCCPPEL